MGEFDVEALERAVAEHPESVEALLDLGLAYFSTERSLEAIETLRRAVELAPDNVEALVLLASVEHQLGLEDEAEERLHYAIELAPQEPAIYRVIAEISERPDQLVDRLFGAARYVELMPSAPDADAYRDTVRRILEEAAATLQTAETSGDAEAIEAALEPIAEILLLMPHVRAALTVEACTPFEAPLRLARLRHAARLALATPPDHPVLGALARQATIPAFEAALLDLGELERLGQSNDEIASLGESVAARRTEDTAFLERVGLTDETAAVFGAIADGLEALDAERPQQAVTAFQQALSTLEPLGDDRTGALALPAAYAYDGLAQALAALAPAEGAARIEHLELALEAAQEASAREPDLPQPYRAPIVAELDALRGGVPPEATTPEAPTSTELPGAESSEEPLATPAEPDEEPAGDVAQPEEEASSTYVVVEAADVRELFDAGEAALAAGDAPAAEEVFAAAAAATDERRVAALAKVGIARARLAAGDRDGAATALDEATHLHNACADAYLLLGDLAADAGNWSQALTHYQYAEGNAPRDPRSQRGIGLALCMLNRWAEAQEPLLDALRANPADAEVCFLLGLVFERAGELTDAAACFEEVANQTEDAALASEASEHLAKVRQAMERESARPARTPAPPPQEQPTAKPVVEEGLDEEDRQVIEQAQQIRQKILQPRPGADSFDEEIHVRCRACRTINDRGDATCRRCGLPLPDADTSAAPTGPAPPAGRPACFIATAACGDPDAPEVVMLRAYRDHVLRRSAGGRLLVALYETCSPPLARGLARRPGWRRFVYHRLVRPLANWAASRADSRGGCR